MTTLIDTKRELIDLALTEGRRRLSPRTDLIHFCYDDEEATDTIPYYENICYCLALFRSCVGDHVQEAKQRLTHLLSFETFPTYLHEYPKHGVTQRLYFPFYWIVKLFSHVIEEPLRSQLIQVLDHLTPFRKPENIRSSKEAASLALHLQLEEETLKPLASYWDPTHGIYTGPLMEEKQRRNLPETTLFDLFMCVATGQFPKRILAPHPVHMHAALVMPTEPVVCAPSRFPTILPTGNQKGFHLFRHIWEGSENHLHTLACQETKMTFQEGVFIYPEEIPDERDRMELSLYCDYHEGVSLCVNGEKSTVFRLGDQVTLKTPNKTFRMTFKIEEGEGTFMGRISRGNRPAQIFQKKETSYDWRITIRTINRTPTLKLGLALIEE